MKSLLPISSDLPEASLQITIIAVCIACMAWGPDPSNAQPQDRAELVTALDSAAQSHAAESTVAGVSVAVARGGETLLHEGYGQADIELDVPMPRDAVVEIGSITKQFTAAAILQLAAKDSVDLDAPITEYLPDFDTGGYVIKVRHLLHHTSGLPDWSHFPETQTLRHQELPRDTVLALLENKMLRFAPGTAMSYSNSGYFLLGQIIQKASGQSYERYVEEHLFQPAGMDDSYYCDERAIVENKAHGYAWTGEKGFKHKKYVDHTWPYAAGSLCSTAGDMVAWTQALHAGDVLPDSMYREMIMPGRLADGTTLRYGMGLVVSDPSGRGVIRHGGGIFGFLSEARYYPEENLTVVVFQNTTGPTGPMSLADELVRLTIGPGSEPETRPFEGRLAKFEGRYSGPARGGLITLRVNAENGKLIVYEVGSDGGPMPLEHATGRTWRRESVRYRFVQAGEEIIEVRIDGGAAHYVLRRVGAN
jgi:CubicO group peptidase (beta-lactamase class C family)